MRLYEHEAKRLLKEAGIAVPSGLLLSSPGGIEEASQKIPLPAVLKAQIFSGGRQKVGGVAFPKDLEEAKAEAERLFGSSLRPERLLWEERIAVQRDRPSDRPPLPSIRRDAC